MLGLHFAGETVEPAEYALACYASSVFEKLEIEPLPPPPAEADVVLNVATRGGGFAHRRGHDHAGGPGGREFLLVLGMAQEGDRVALGRRKWRQAFDRQPGIALEIASEGLDDCA